MEEGMCRSSDARMLWYLVAVLTLAGSLQACQGGTATVPAPGDSTLRNAPGPLTRAVAGALIQKSSEISSLQTFTFHEGKQCAEVDMINHRNSANYQQLIQLKEHVYMSKAGHLDNANYVTITIMTPKDWASDAEYFRDQQVCNPMMGEWINVALTPRGLAASKQWTRNSDGSYTVPVGSRTFVEVTGITDGADQQTQVEFTWRSRSMPVLDEVYATNEFDLHRGTAMFKRYDDGWRLMSMK
jgi:hypothetical protein